MAALILIAAAVVALWLISARFWPWKRCPVCKGSRRVQGIGGFRECTRCDKDGKVPRWGASIGR